MNIYINIYRVLFSDFLPSHCVYCTGYELRITFIAFVMRFFLHTSFKLLFICEVRLWLIVQVTSYFITISYKLLFVARVKIFLDTFIFDSFLIWKMSWKLDLLKFLRNNLKRNYRGKNNFSWTKEVLFQNQLKLLYDSNSSNINIFLWIKNGLL